MQAKSIAKILQPDKSLLDCYRATIQYPGRAKLNITPISNPTDTAITPAHTYKLADSHQMRTALGWVNGVDHWAYNSAGVPKVVSYETIVANGVGPAMYSGEKGVSVYAPQPSAATELKIWKYLKGHTFQALTIDGEQLFIDGEPVYVEVV